MKKKYLISALVIIFILGLGLTVMAETNEPVLNSEINERAERGPGVYCSVCDGEPQALENRALERRELNRGERGEFRQQQNSKQRAIQGQ